MTNLPKNPDERKPVVFEKDGAASADSRDVASYFEKEHKNVLRDIRELNCSPEFHKLNFEPFKINDLTGESTSHYTMSRDGFVFLVMGFTGAKAAKWKEDYITAFNAMEKQLQETKPLVSQFDMMRAVIDNLESNNQRLFSVEKAIENFGAHEDYRSIKAHAALIGVRISTKESNDLGRTATALSKQENQKIGTQPDETFGRVNTYHRSVLESVFEDFKGRSIGKTIEDRR